MECGGLLCILNYLIPQLNIIDVSKRNAIRREAKDVDLIYIIKTDRLSKPVNSIYKAFFQVCHISKKPQ